jgi:hypothetical protein
MVEPILFDVGSVPDTGLERPTMIRLPNPASYVLQKLLAWPLRVPEKKAKDLAYVYEVAVLTQKQWQSVSDAVVTLKSHFPKPWFVNARNLVINEFESETSDGTIAVVRQYGDVPGRAPDERTVWHTITAFAEAKGIV